MLTVLQVPVGPVSSKCCFRSKYKCKKCTFLTESIVGITRSWNCLSRGSLYTGTVCIQLSHIFLARSKHNSNILSVSVIFVKKGTASNSNCKSKLYFRQISSPRIRSNTNYWNLGRADSSRMPPTAQMRAKVTKL